MRPLVALEKGSSIGSYQITGALGKGGMGEVYRARDSKLKREVAIKSLPAAFAGDTERLARFQREAETLASLNHPNIGAIYGLEEFNEMRFLVLELVEGETLAERLKRGPMSLDDALRLAIQIAGSLEAAHEKGVIHRDLKPANIKITPEGQVKVLDFGLARAMTEVSPTGDKSDSPTLSIAATRDGVILGTAAYMSPEQAKGRTVDKRSDIFSFGCILYEMLTGRQAFDGDEITEILSRILQRDPEWTALPANTPARVAEVLRSCLEKDVQNRRRDIGDVRLDLQQASKDPEVVPATAARSPRLAWTLFGAAALLVLLLSVPATLHLREAPAGASEIRVEINTPATANPLAFAVSPDNEKIAFVASGDGLSRLWVRSFNSTTAQPLPGTEGAEYPFWSPDSRSLGFFAAAKLKRLNLDGGQPQILADASGGRGGTWSTDGIILFASSIGGPLLRIAATGGDATPVTKIGEGQTGHRFPQFLSDSKRFLFFVQGGAEQQGIYLGSLDREESKRVLTSDWAGVVAAGRLFYVREGVLVARHFDTPTGEFTGEAITLADPVGCDTQLNFCGLSASEGVVAYRSAVAGRRQLTWFDRTGKPAGTALQAGDEASMNAPELSPDGRRIAVGRTVQTNMDIWMIDVARDRLSRFTFDAALDNYPAWSPDGTRIVFRTNRKGSFDFYVKASSGVGGEDLLWQSPHTKFPIQWSPDGKFLLFYDIDPKSSGDLWLLPVTGEKKPAPLVNTPFDERNGQLSPDGKWLAYQSNESGRYEVYIQPLSGPLGKWQVSTNGGTQPRWRADVKEVYFIAPDAKLMAASVTVRDGIPDTAPPVPLFQTRISGGVGGSTTIPKHQYAVSPDGRFLVNTLAEESTTAPIRLILNWNRSK